MLAARHLAEVMCLMLAGSITPDRTNVEAGSSDATAHPLSSPSTLPSPKAAAPACSFCQTQLAEYGACELVLYLMGLGAHHRTAMPLGLALGIGILEDLNVEQKQLSEDQKRPDVMCVNSKVRP